jgi:hypothetical protein
VWIGVASDNRVVPDPEHIVASFVQELKFLQELASQQIDKMSAPYEPLLSELGQTLDALDDALDHAVETPPAD